MSDGTILIPVGALVSPKLTYMMDGQIVTGVDCDWLGNSDLR
jgi:hypothetical protein